MKYKKNPLRESESFLLYLRLNYGYLADNQFSNNLTLAKILWNLHHDNAYYCF